MADSNAKTWNIAGVEFNAPYMMVWAALLFLTLVEVAIPEMSGQKELLGISMSRGISVMLLIGLAVAKTYLVAWFYMHLIDERPMLVLVASAPFIFSVFLTIGLFPWVR